MTAAPIGAFCLGVVLAYLSMYFVHRLRSYTLIGLGGLVSILLGGVVAAFLAQNASDQPDFAWWYPIGLMAGLAAWGLGQVQSSRHRR